MRYQDILGVHFLLLKIITPLILLKATREKHTQSIPLLLNGIAVNKSQVFIIIISVNPFLCVRWVDRNRLRAATEVKKNIKMELKTGLEKHWLKSDNDPWVKNRHITFSKAFPLLTWAWRTMGERTEIIKAKTGGNVRKEKGTKS